MSIPPQLIRVKRKRVDEAPVTFLQFDQGAKRHRSGSNWVYQRRLAVPKSTRPGSSIPSSNDVKPVIHVSAPDDESLRSGQHDGAANATPQAAGASSAPDAVDESRLTEPRRFHISRKMMMPSAGQHSSGGISRKARYGPAVFVERSRAKARVKAVRINEGVATKLSQSISAGQDADVAVEQPTEERTLKKPSVRSRNRSPKPDSSAPTTLPSAVMKPHEDMAQITADMNDWVMREIGANLESMEQEKQAEKARFKPKAPSKRYSERHPGAVASMQAESPANDMAMTDVSDVEDEEDDWVIEEYIRIPAHAMTSDVTSADVGVLVLDGEEDSNLFYGPEHDEEEDLDLDDEDENAENYYTADYPEDEVDSDDEYGRHPYDYRNANASDDEEYDNEFDSDADDDMVIEPGNDDDDATMARIKAYMKRSNAFH